MSLSDHVPRAEAPAPVGSRKAPAGALTTHVGLLVADEVVCALGEEVDRQAPQASVFSIQEAAAARLEVEPEVSVVIGPSVLPQAPIEALRTLAGQVLAALAAASLLPVGTGRPVIVPIGVPTGTTDAAGPEVDAYGVEVEAALAAVLPAAQDVRGASIGRVLALTPTRDVPLLALEVDAGLETEAEKRVIVTIPAAVRAPVEPAVVHEAGPRVPLVDVGVCVLGLVRTVGREFVVARFTAVGPSTDRDEAAQPRAPMNVGRDTPAPTEIGRHKGRDPGMAVPPTRRDTYAKSRVFVPANT